MHWPSLAEIREKTRTEKLAVNYWLDRFLERAGHWAAVNAFVGPAAPQRHERPAGREFGTLGGAPLAVKDIIDVAGEVTSAASKVLAGHRAQADAPVIARLRDFGATFIGKTNLHEFAYGGSGMISAYGPVKNPWNMEHITGGSSSGSAAAVAAGLCAAAIGTDTAGSIRLPASCCGIVGFKPTYGTVSAEGVIPLSVSYDHVGPMTRCVEDARYLFELMSGLVGSHPPRDRKLRVGIPETFFYRELDPSVAKAMDDVLGALHAAGHELVSHDFEVDEDRTLSSYESYVYHKKWVEECPELYQPETLRRIKSGEKITAEQAEDAASRLKALRARAAERFTGIDVMLTPTVPILPPRIADLLAKPETLRPAELVMLRNTRPFNVLGVPAISVPWDLSASGLPIGIQLAAGPGQDFELLDVAEELERMAPWQGRVAAGFA